MAKLLLHKNFRVFPGFHFIFCSLCFFNSCATKQADTVLDSVYIQGIHDDHDIWRADSLFLLGKLDEAALLFSKQKSDGSKQLYCQARLAEMDYYLRQLYGLNHIDYTTDAVMLPVPSDALDSFYVAIHDFYTLEKLDTAIFNKKWSRVYQILGPEHYLSNKGHAILGEYFYTMNFNGELLDLHFNKHQSWCQSLPHKIYDCFWTNIRLTSSGTYDRNHLESIVNCNELIEEPEWKEIFKYFRGSEL